MFVRPVHLAPRPSLVAADLDANFAPLVAGINGGLDATSYVENLGLPNAMKGNAGSVFPVQLRIRRIEFNLPSFGAAPWKWQFALCEPSSMLGYLPSYFDETQTAEIYRVTDDPAPQTPIPISWSLYYGAGDAVTGTADLQRWRNGVGAPDVAADSAAFAAAAPGRVFRRNIPAGLAMTVNGAWWITLSLTAVGTPPYPPYPVWPRDLLFTVWFKMPQVR